MIALEPRSKSSIYPQAPSPVKDEDNKPLMLFGKYGYRYDSVCLLDINYWAFRGIGKAQDRADIKLPLGHVLRHTYGWAVAEVSLHSAKMTSL